MKKFFKWFVISFGSLIGLIIVIAIIGAATSNDSPDTTDTNQVTNINQPVNNENIKENTTTNTMEIEEILPLILFI